MRKALSFSFFCLLGQIVPHTWFTALCSLLSVHRPLLTAEFKKEIGHTT